jgi:uncharacterized phiE125 gp8 family phage protein
MPTTQVLTPPTTQAEPVSLALANAQLRLDLDLSSIDPAIVGQIELLQLKLSAAREMVEAYTGRYFSAQTLAITYELGEGYTLPAGATVVSVSGFFSTLEELANASTYLEEYRKGISINRELPWAEAMRQTFTVEVTIGTEDEPVFVPAIIKEAILELTGEMYRNRETSQAGYANVPELPVSWRVKLAPLRVTVLGE